MSEMQVQYIAHSGSDLLVVNAARVSFAKESKQFNDKDQKLITYLAEHKHWLPFRHPQVTLRCKAPLPIARHLGKHQVGFSWSEESRRYIDTPPEFYWPDKWRKRAENKKQGSTDEESEWMIGDKDGQTYEDYGWSLIESLSELYTNMIHHGVAPEQARLILPLNMMVNWVWTGSLLGWAQMCKARLADDAQRETQEFARKVQDVVAPLYPVSWDNLMKYL